MTGDKQVSDDQSKPPSSDSSQRQTEADAWGSLFAAAADSETPEALEAVLRAVRDPKRLRRLMAAPSPVDGRTLLHLAVAAADEEKARRLVSKGASVNVKAQGDNCTPLHIAAASGNKEIIRFLVKEGASINTAVTGGWTPLHLAIQNGHRSAADFLCANGANISAATQFRLTPLHLAAWHGHASIAADLLWRGARPSCRDRCGRSPLHLAAWAGHTSVACMLAGRPGGAKLLAALDADGGTPLHDAALNGRARCISALAARVEAAALPLERRNKFGHTPLHEAVNKGHVAAAGELLLAGSDPNAATSYGCTPLHLSIALGGLPCFQRLLRAPGLDLNRRTTSDGNTPLHWAVWYRLPGAVEELLDLGADTTVTDKGGNTPLHWAAFQGHTTTAAHLLSATSEPLSIRNEAGAIPMDLARDWSHYECGALLLSALTGEAFCPLVPQRLSSSSHISEDERPLLSFLPSSNDHMQRAGQSYVFGPRWQAPAQTEPDASFRTSMDWLRSMKAPVYGRSNSRNGRQISNSGDEHGLESGAVRVPSIGLGGRSLSSSYGSLGCLLPASLDPRRDAPLVADAYHALPPLGSSWQRGGGGGGGGGGLSPAGVMSSISPRTSPTIDAVSRVGSTSPSPGTLSPSPLAAAPVPLPSPAPPLGLPPQHDPSWMLDPCDLSLCVRPGAAAGVKVNSGTLGEEAPGSFLEELGRGPWGPVHKGLLYGTDPVAVRKFALRGDDPHLEAVLAVLSHLNTLRHPSLVMFLGAVVLENEVCLVSEYLDGHTLEAKLSSPGHQGPGGLWDATGRRAVLSCARALNYLHHQRPPVVHGNVCARSVILCDGSRSGDKAGFLQQGVLAKLSGTKMLTLECLAADAALQGSVSPLSPPESRETEQLPGALRTDGSASEGIAIEAVGSCEHHQAVSYEAPASVSGWDSQGWAQQPPACHLAPEVTAGAAPGPPADVFCLGLLLKQLSEHEASPPEALQALVLRCLDPTPSERPAAAEVILSLEAL